MILYIPRKIKGDLKIFSWVWSKMLPANSNEESIIFQEQELMNELNFWRSNKGSRNVKDSL